MILFIIFTIPFDYIFPGAGAKGLSTGSYFTENDITSLWWNPANISGVNHSIYFDWTSLIQTFNLLNGAICFNIKNTNVGFGVNYFTSGDMPLNPEIEDTIIPENSGYFDVTERSLTLSIARRLKFMDIGFSIRNYEQEMLNFHGVGYGYDFGLTLKNKIILSLIFKDILNTEISWFGRMIDKIPQSTIFALSIPYKYKYYKGIIESSILIQEKRSIFSIGSILTMRDIISLRFGYSALRGFSSGISLDLSIFSLYYTIVNSNFEPTHIFGVEIKRR
uniref:PorV/PorQ family protein n=1 Tax=candidate division WOR-3 bacterium TaxID=2052148 RepID=A0A7C4U786_UNCW3